MCMHMHMCVCMSVCMHMHVHACTCIVCMCMLSRTLLTSFNSLLYYEVREVDATVAAGSDTADKWRPCGREDWSWRDEWIMAWAPGGIRKFAANVD